LGLPHPQRSSAAASNVAIEFFFMSESSAW
jgi:hypothetical protein